jgi:acetyl esterase/lipase
MHLRASRVIAVAIIAAAAASLANCGRIAYAVVNVPAHVGWYERKANIAYGNESRQTLDVYAPVGAFNRPIVVFWYGGIWIKGTKEDYRFVGAALANAGYVAVLPDYRLYPQVRYPTFVEDGALALRWAHEHAAEIGGSPRSLFLMGHSAGAHIAASLALDPRHLRKVGGDASWVRGWIGLAGPYELEKRIPLLDEIFREPYTSADWQPLLLVHEHTPPALLLQGTDDYIVRVKEAVHLDEKLRAAGVPVECHIYDEVGHFTLVSALSVPFRAEAPSLQDVSRFIDRIVGADESVYLPCPYFPNLD